MIGIIAAMQEETDYLIEHMTEVEKITIGSLIFFKGKIKHVHVVLLKCGIGKVNAAMGAALLIERFKPSHIINTGSAGGLDSTAKIGDVVISTEVRHHDVDLTALGCEYGQLLFLPAGFDPCLLLIAAATRAAEKMHISVKQGLIVSGDSFIHQDADIKKIKQNFPDVHAVEMEGAAIAQVCHQFKIPFVIIRALSDIAGKESPLSFEQFLKQAGQNSAQLVLYTLENMEAG